MTKPFNTPDTKQVNFTAGKQFKLIKNLTAK